MLSLIVSRHNLKLKTASLTREHSDIKVKGKKKAMLRYYFPS